MKSILTIILITVLCSLLAACSTQAASTTLEVLTPSPQATTTPFPSAEDPLISAAQDFIAELRQGDYAAGYARFDDTMKAALPEDKLEELWGQLLDQVGEYQEQVGVRSESQEGYQIVILTTRFVKALLDVRVVFDSQGMIAGLFFAPAQQGEAQPYTPPDYVDGQAFSETEVEIGSGEWTLPGALTLPKGDGPFPAVILVHGSGPNDRDETIGPNKPFRDLAWGLATRGIAVLRYDKRTLTHSGKYSGSTLANLTLQDETIDDALLAANLLRETEKIDPERIYVLGHSLGALAAPRIGE